MSSERRPSLDPNQARLQLLKPKPPPPSSTLAAFTESLPNSLISYDPRPNSAYHQPVSYPYQPQPTPQPSPPAFFISSIPLSNTYQPTHLKPLPARPTLTSTCLPSTSLHCAQPPLPPPPLPAFPNADPFRTMFISSSISSHCQLPPAPPPLPRTTAPIAQSPDPVMPPYVPSPPVIHQPMTLCPPTSTDPVYADLPVHVTLFYLVQLHLQAARELAAQLCLRPEAELAIRTHRRHLAIAIASLRAIVSLSGTLPVEDDLRARWMLANVLVRETTGSCAEVSELVQGALSIARGRPGLARFAFGMSEIEIWGMMEDGSGVGFRQVRKAIERAIERTMRLEVVDPAHVEWYYRFQLLLSHVCEQRDQAEAAQAALEPVLSLAMTRGDIELWVAVRAREAKMGLERGEWTRTGERLRSIANVAKLPRFEGGLAGTDKAEEELVKLGPALERYVLLLMALYHFTLGELGPAKQCVNFLQASLAQPVEPDEIEDTYQLPIRPSPPSPELSSASAAIDSPLTRRFKDVSLNTHSSKSLSVSITTLPRPLFRVFIHLLSAAVHFDGHGKRPKCVGYLDQAIVEIGKGRRMERMWVEAMLMRSQLAIVRSNFLGADEALWEVIAWTLRTSSWDKYGARIGFLKGMLSHATGNFSQAKASLRASIVLALHPSSSLGAEIGVLAKAGYVLIASNEGEAEALTKELGLLEGTVLRRLELAIQVVLAMRCGAIVRAKHYLTNALDHAHALVNTHIKTILLGLLGNLFLNTRPDQALKMLQSCAKACAGFREQEVGMAWLGLWAGEKLLELYQVSGDEERGKKQAAANVAYQTVLGSIPLL
ncbi:hypothetical protein CROQUDRAFT_649740 [Cronartium quercuum f. sp. fusiforme G11]|uniref:Uncharacterized protein n=1 Tax=Cronartium quercuum f. sp. fusiforme G11 TaxID=708437 RepID=A0A9P6TJ18_9BASI|nr:hypothetical protein CROQUDRAFT_649740 [Cronartium quercuum f. sp. fusiforme G11]